MEMMIVLTIVAIVAAVAAPMVNKKILATAGEKSPWVFTGQGRNITFNVNGDNDTATIGAVDPPNLNPKLYIKTSNTEPHIMFGRGNQDNVASLRVSTDKLFISNGDFNNWQDSEDYVKLGGNGTIADNSVAVGFGTRVSEGSISIGRNVQATGNNSIAIGGSFSNASQIEQPEEVVNLFGNAAWAEMFDPTNPGSGNTSSGGGYYYYDEQYKNKYGDEKETTSSSSSGSGNGSGSDSGNGNEGVPNDNENNNNVPQQGGGAGIERTAATADRSIAIGHLTQANAVSSVAIGAGASVNPDAINSVAIGASALADEANTIVLGDTNTTVIIPGTLRAGSGAFVVEPNVPPVLGSVTCNAPLTASRETTLEDTTVDGTLTVTGATTLGTTLDVTGNTTVGGTLGVTGATILNDTTVQTTLATDTLSLNDLWVGELYLNSEEVVIENEMSFKGGRYLKVPMTSDRRLKNVGEAFTAGLEEIKKLEVFNYTFKKDESKTPRVGVMAQDLEKIFPKAVFKGEDGFLRIRMEDMFYALVNAVKQLDAKIEELKNNEILTLKNRLDDLEKANKELVKLNKDLQEQNEDLIKENKKFEKRLDKLEKKLNKKLED